MSHGLLSNNSIWNPLCFIKIYILLRKWSTARCSNIFHCLRFSHAPRVCLVMCQNWKSGRPSDSLSKRLRPRLQRYQATTHINQRLVQCAPLYRLASCDSEKWANVTRIIGLGPFYHLHFDLSWYLAWNWFCSKKAKTLIIKCFECGFKFDVFPQKSFNSRTLHSSNTIFTWLHTLESHQCGSGESNTFRANP